MITKAFISYTWQSIWIHSDAGRWQRQKEKPQGMPATLLPLSKGLLSLMERWVHEFRRDAKPTEHLD